MSVNWNKDRGLVFLTQLAWANLLLAFCDDCSFPMWTVSCVVENTWALSVLVHRFTTLIQWFTVNKTKHRLL